MINFNWEAINAVAARWAETIWAVSWQFGLLGLIVLIAHWSLQRAAPSWRYWLWQILAIKLLLMPCWTAIAPWKWPDTASTSEPAASSKPAETIEGSRLDGLRNPDKLQPSAVETSSVVTTKSEVARVPSPAAAPLIDQKVTRVAKNQPNSPTESVPSQKRPKVALDQSTVPVLTDPKSVSLESSADHLVTRPPQTAPSNSAPIPVITKPNPVAVHGPTLSWQAWLMLAWIAGVIWTAGRIIWQGISLGRRLRQTTVAEQALMQRVQDAASKLGLRRIPSVRVIDLDISPFVCGLWRPSLIVPRELLSSFTVDQLDLVLLHELAHVRRRDLIWGWIPEIGRILFFFHPVVHFLCYQIRFERELACDQLAMLKSGRDAASYADTLVRVVGQFSGPDSLQLAAGVAELGSSK